MTDHIIESKEVLNRYNTQLTCVIIIGRILQLDHMLITLCPGEKCGRPMIIDAEKNIHTERGLVCCVCSERIRLQRQVDLAAQIVTSAQNCLMCNRSLERCAPRDIFLYPAFTRVCRKHHSETIRNVLIRAVDTARLQQIDLTTTEVLQCFLKVRDDQRSNYKQLHHKRNQQHLARERQRTRARK